MYVPLVLCIYGKLSVTYMYHWLISVQIIFWEDSYIHVHTSMVCCMRLEHILVAYCPNDVNVAHGNSIVEEGVPATVC